MKYKHILLTGSSGTLGRAILSSKRFSSLLAPSRHVLDITDPASIGKFYRSNKIDAVIHCAAMARMSECDKDPREAIRVNIIGTSYLVRETLKKEKALGKNIRFIYISTDGVYPGTGGRYSERSAVAPYNKYGWTKLGGECVVSVLDDHCIIRTNFFNPERIPFADSSVDSYSSRLPVSDLAEAVYIMANNSFVGIINIGGKRQSDYERYRAFKPGLKQSSFRKISGAVPFKMAKDASLDVRMWNRIKRKRGAACRTLT